MRCNIFKPLSSNTGEFLTFSQYVDDLTKSQAEGANYRIVPSRFAILNINVEELLEGYRSVAEVDDVNKVIPQLMQSHFENSVAYLFESEELAPLIEDKDFSVTSELLWSTLRHWHFIHEEDLNVGDSNMKYFPELKYIGDINIHSNHQVDSFNYNEITCYIPTNEKEKYYKLVRGRRVQNDLDQTEIDTVTLFPETPIEDGTIIKGWTPMTYPQDYPLSYKGLTDLGEGSQTGFYTLDDYRPEELEPDQDANSLESNAIDRPAESDDSNDQYQFNCIVLFYDVYYNQPDDSFRTIYRNRPLGIYFTGMINEEENGLENTVTKFVSNQDAFGQGTSYCLRVLSRYVPTPNSETYTIETTTDSGDEDYNNLALVMGRLSDTMTEVGQAMKDHYSILQSFKNHFALFRNNRTNVPYPRKVDGQYYWFVNGRNTGMLCTTASTIAGPQGATGRTGAQGIMGLQGVQGAQGSWLAYTYRQTSDSRTWYINHNLGTYPSVSVTDVNGIVITCEVEYVDENNIILNFTNPSSGTAYLN